MKGLQSVKEVQTCLKAGLQPDSIQTRWIMDQGICAASRGYAQLVSSLDSTFFGQWIHPGRREIVTFDHGDIHEDTYADDDALIGAYLDIHDDLALEGETLYGSDPGSNADTMTRLKDLGLPLVTR